MHDVAGIDEADAGDAGRGGLDRGVVELELRLVDRGLVDLDGAGELADLRLVLLDLLRGHQLLRLEALVALEVQLVRLELGLVAREGALGGEELHAKRARIDLRDDVTLLDELALGEEDGVEAAVDLGVHGDLLDGGDGAEPLEPDRDVALLGHDGLHRHDPLARPAARAAAPRALPVAPVCAGSGGDA